MFRIEDLELQRLSGPASFRYLVPKKRVFVEKVEADERIFLPIIILLGDVHRTDDRRCADCDEEKGCYKVESHTLLSCIDNIARQIPVDFYTEYDASFKILEKGVLFNDFQRVTFGCHNTRRRVTPFYECDFPHVRWHYTDTRFWSLSDKFESFEAEVTRYLNSISDMTQPNPMTEADEIPTDAEQMLHQFMKILYRINGDPEQLALMWSRELSQRILTHPHSLIRKQLQSYAIDLNVELYCYLNIYRDIGTFKTLMGGNSLSADTIQALTQYMFVGGVIAPSAKIKYSLKLIRLLWMYCNASLLDLYFITRMFKPPRDSINSYLTLGFFGEAHSKCIADFLVHSLQWYDLKMESSSDQLRCQSVSGVTNLNEDLLSYIRLRTTYQSLDPYTRKLQFEQQARALDPALFQPIHRDKPQAPELTAEDIRRHVNRWFNLSTETVRYLNVVAERIIRDRVRPVDGAVTFYNVTNSEAIAERWSIVNGYFVEYLPPLLVEALVHQYLGVLPIERSALAAIGNTIYEQLYEFVKAVLESPPRYPALIDINDIQRFIRQTQDFNRSPFTPFQLEVQADEILLLPREVLSGLLPRETRTRLSSRKVRTRSIPLTDFDVEYLNSIANRVVTVFAQDLSDSDHPFVIEVLEDQAESNGIPLEVIQHMMLFHQVQLTVPIPRIAHALSHLLRDIMIAAAEGDIKSAVDLGGPAVHYINEPPFGEFDTAFSVFILDPPVAEAETEDEAEDEAETEDED